MPPPTAAYMRQYRASRPHLRERERRRNRAYSLAERRLREMFPAVFEHLLEEAKKELGA